MKNLVFEEFVDMIQKGVQNSLGNDFVVSTERTKKNNGIVWTGLLIHTKEYNITPTIYLDYFYDEFRCGETPERIIESIIETFWRELPRRKIDVNFFYDYNIVKERICFRLINQTKNKEILEDIPYIPFLDLAVCFYYSFADEQIGEGSILIKNEHLKLWNIELEELHEVARKNTPTLFPGEILPIWKVLEDIAMEKGIALSKEEAGLFLDEEGITDMFVVTNKCKFFGSSVMLYPAFLEGVAQKLEDDLYIIPSSIHELIVIRKRNHDNPEFLLEMIHSVNDTEVEDTEILSNSLYTYSREKSMVEFVGSYV